MTEVIPGDDRAINSERQTVKTTGRNCEQRTADRCSGIIKAYMTFIGQGTGAFERER